MEPMEFTTDLNFQPHYGPGVNSAPKRNENNRYLQRRKGGRCKEADNLTASCTE